MARSIPTTDWQRLSETKEPSVDFELHYGLSSRSVRGVLDEILSDMARHTPIHNWDDKLITKPLETLARVVRSYLSTHNFMLNTLLGYTSVEEVLTVSGTNHVRPAMQGANDIDQIESHLFFGKRPSNMDSHSTPSPQKYGMSSCPFGVGPTSEDDSNLLGFGQGRIVYITEQVSHLNRATLLIVYAFCIRLQYEDCGYIGAFIERHLSLRCILKIPYHWQQSSPLELNSSQQRCYKRVTISFHITYLKLDSNEVDDRKDIFDRDSLFPYLRKPGVENPNGLYLFKASSSILLTLAIPEESESHEEEISLLQCPQALWTVLVINSLQRFASDHSPAQHSTPIAQFIRGITSSLCTQRINAQYIYDALRNELKTCDDGSLFDDEHFTKSTLYHFAIKACDELEASISSSLRFVQKTRDSYVTQLCREAHAHERLGIDHWSQKMEEEISALEDLQAQIHAVGSQAQESRNALSGITAVLEARMALQQGNRMKTLAYLATIYLPLTAASSVYSISVLPESASFASFLIFLAILLLFTTLLGLKLSTLSTLLATIAPVFRKSTLESSWRDLLPALPPWMENYIKLYMSLLDRTSSRGFWDFLGESSQPPTTALGWELLYFLYQLILFAIRILPALLLRYCLVPEILYPRYQWFLFQYRHNRYMTIKYHPILFIIDIIRFALIPVWIVLAACIICFFVLLDVFLLGPKLFVAYIQSTAT
ncbi:uncharacterized protein TRIVIDRAFT_222235 [Trichoderma virens Gv29-8]|uniref:Uncharacterized protein n=1 Tax=Hypocrea virens (strain Gv29-8 / FGSC 10586) TaxID=413071 RepID=G9MSH3_HYPVG|nr:uncharacterized protein TRIVIDRAFT_222235 [Trichoderma virens Gv29-8]EHK22977.1 hypothetical protein TRIVIDRAFT_222235 [Trichoderma virens Gv29-8]